MFAFSASKLCCFLGIRIVSTALDCKHSPLRQKTNKKKSRARVRAQTLHSPDQLWRCWKPFLRLLNVSEKCWKRENVFFRAYHTATGLTQRTLPFPVFYLFKLLRCECFWKRHIFQIYQNTSVLNSSMPFPHLAMCWFYWEGYMKEDLLEICKTSWEWARNQNVL